MYFIIRCLFLLAGTVLLLDAVLPLRVENVTVTPQVERKFKETPRRAGATRRGPGVFGPGVTHCALDPAMLELLNEGDPVEVHSTRLTERCMRVVRGGQDLYRPPYKRLMLGIGGALFIAAVVFRWRFRVGGNSGR